MVVGTCPLKHLSNELNLYVRCIEVTSPFRVPEKPMHSALWYLRSRLSKLKQNDMKYNQDACNGTA